MNTLASESANGPHRRIYLSPPHVGGEERELLLEALESNWIAPLGPHVDAFEQEFAARMGSQGQAAALSSGTAALHLALRLVGVKAGDEVLVSTLTFVATANAVAYLGAVPVYIDSDESTWNMHPGLLEEELTECARRGRLPKAVVVVDLYGHCADYDPILEVCGRYAIPVIEDAAEALGATYKGRSAGTVGGIGVFSFNGNKIITTSGGGMLFAERDDWVRKARFWASQARDDAPHYEHSELGYNYRLSNLLAAVGRAQLRSLDWRIELRKANREHYRQALGDLAGVTFIPEPEYGRGNGWLTCILIDPAKAGVCRETVRCQLESANIESRPLWKPMHLQPLYKGCRIRGGAVSEQLFRNGLCLPSGSNLSEEERERVVAAVRACFHRAG